MATRKSGSPVRDCASLPQAIFFRTPMNSTTSNLPLPFDHVEAHAYLSKIDKHLARLITQVGGFRFKLDECDSVYESLLEAIMHQSIAGKAAQAIFARIKALGTNGNCPTPEELLRVPERKLRRLDFRKQKSPPCATWRRKQSTA